MAEERERCSRRAQKPRDAFQGLTNEMSVMLFTGPEGKSQLRIANTVGAVGIELALSPAVGWLLGRFADQHFSSAPLGSYLGLAVGFLAGFRALFRVARRTHRELTENHEHAGEAARGESR